MKAPQARNSLSQVRELIDGRSAALAASHHGNLALPHAVQV